MLFLLFTAAFGAITAQEYDANLKEPGTFGTSHIHRRRLAEEEGCERAENDMRDFCTMYTDTRERERRVEEARYALAPDCDDNAHILMLTRGENDSSPVAFVTETPEHAFQGMIDFFRDMHEDIDDLHNLILSYQLETRDGQKRTLRVTNDMDLYSAFMLQKKFHVTELLVTIDSNSPTYAPSPPTPAPTGVPTGSPVDMPKSYWVYNQGTSGQNKIIKSTDIPAVQSKKNQSYEGCHLR